MSLYPVDLTKLNFLWTSLKRSAGLRTPNERAKLAGIVENRHDHNISEAELLVRNSRGDSSIGVQCREGAHNAVLGRAHGMTDLL